MTNDRYTRASPLVSILIPVRNEERYIERCLYSIAAQDYPIDRIELLVIDGMSSDSTAAIVSRFAAESTIDLLLLQNPAVKPAAALNLGLDAARGEIIIRVDGHAAVAPDFVRQSVAALTASGAGCVGGAIESEGDTYTGRAIALAMSSRFGVGGAAFRTGGEGPVDTVAFGAYRRDVFDRIGHFENIDGGEDDEFNYRLLDDGGTILLVRSIRSSYTVRGDLASLWRQYFRYGRAKPEVLRRHPRQMRVRQLVPPAFVATVAALAIALPRVGVAPLRTLVIVYTLLATVVSLALTARRSWRMFPPLPLVFGCLHVSYGLGFLAGVVGLPGRISGQRASSGAQNRREARP